MNTTRPRRVLPKKAQPQQELPQLQTPENSADTFPDLFSTYGAEDVSPHSPTSSTTTTTTSTVSESSSASWLWPLPSQTDETESRTELSLRPQRTPQNGPQNVARPTARRVQRCGVGRSRHAHAHAHADRDRPCKSQATLLEVRCWDHGCEGRKFSSLGNYRRHLREKNGQAKVHPCPDCGRVFTRSTARNFHRESGTCGLSARQLMLQMQMQVQVQMQQTQQVQQAQPLLASTASCYYPPLNVPSPPFDFDWSSQIDMYSPGLLWGNAR